MLYAHKTKPVALYFFRLNKLLTTKWNLSIFIPLFLIDIEIKITKTSFFPPIFKNHNINQIIPHSNFENETTFLHCSWIFNYKHFNVLGNSLLNKKLA